MKKTLAIILAVVFALTMLGACASQPEATVDEPQQTEAAATAAPETTGA